MEYTAVSERLAASGQYLTREPEGVKMLLKSAMLLSSHVIGIGANDALELSDKHRRTRITT